MTITHLLFTPMTRRPQQILTMMKTAYKEDYISSPAKAQVNMRKLYYTVKKQNIRIQKYRNMKRQ